MSLEGDDMFVNGQSTTLRLPDDHFTGRDKSLSWGNNSIHYAPQLSPNDSLNHLITGADDVDIEPVSFQGIETPDRNSWSEIFVSSMMISPLYKT